MAMTAQVKSELTSIQVTKPCCRKAEVSSVLRFAGGLFAGLGTLFFLAYNGAFAGALAGYLAERGMSATFFSFVATHSAFELTAIVLSGAAGLRIGHSLLAPGRLRRRPSLVRAAEDTAVLLYGVVALLDLHRVRGGDEVRGTLGCHVWRLPTIGWIWSPGRS